MKLDAEENVPEYDQVFRDEDSEEEDEERFDTEASLLKRRDRRIWEEERKSILFSYTRDSYFGSSSAVILYLLAALASALLGFVWIFGAEQIENPQCGHDSNTYWVGMAIIILLYLAQQFASF